MYFKTLTHKLIFVICIVMFVVSCGQKKTAEVNDTKDSLVNNTIIKEASIAIEKDPSNPELFYQRAVSYFNLKYLDRSLADINEAIRLNNQNPLYQFYKGKLCYAMNKTMDSEKAYLAAISIKPDYTDAQMNLAELYYVVKKHTESINLLNSVQAAHPDKAEVYFIKGMNFKEMGDTGKSIASFQKALEFDPSNYNADVQLGYLFAAQKNKSAADYLTAAIKLQRRNPEAYFARAYYYQQVGQFQKALFDYRKVIDIDPSNDLAYYNVGCINFDVKQFAEAERAFNICIQMNNDNVRAYYMRGLIHEIHGKKSEAKQNYTYALSLDPNFELAKTQLEGLK